MRKKIFGRQLKRDANERKALFKSLMSSLVIHGRIKTTEAKAKAIKGQIEKLVTRAKKGESIANSLQLYLSPDSVKKIIKEVAPQFYNRPGGYTRIVKLGNRFSDNAAVVILEWVEQIAGAKPVEEKSTKAKPQAEDMVEKAIPAPKAKKPAAKKAPVKAKTKKESK
jgi:large subunit ribosomal protein L17